MKVKYVKKAKMWCVTYFITTKYGKEEQVQKWFDTEEAARAFKIET